MKPADVLAHNRALVTRIQTEGAKAAYEAALAVCLDKTAPAPARATCATTILRAAGFLSARDDTAAKEPHQMTATELEARIAELRVVEGSREAEDIPDQDPDSSEGVFG